MQRRLDQPLLIYASKDFSLPSGFDSSLLTALDPDYSILGYMHSQLPHPSPEREPEPAGQPDIMPLEFALGQWKRQGYHKLTQKTASTKQDETELPPLEYHEPGFIANDYFKQSSHLKM